MRVGGLGENPADPRKVGSNHVARAGKQMPEEFLWSHVADKNRRLETNLARFREDECTDGQSRVDKQP